MHYFLKTLLFVSAVLLFFAYIAYSIPSRPSLPPEEGAIDFSAVKTKQDLVAVGQKLFFGKGQCALCHSIGESETARCPNLEGIGAKLSREFIYESLTRPDAYIYKQYEFSPPKPFAAQMPQINRPPVGLSDNELLAVIAFVQSTGGSEYVTVDPSELKKPAEEVLLAAGDAGRGRALYDDLGCARCHAPGGDTGGGERAADSIVAVQGQDPLQLLSVFRSGGENHAGYDTRLTLKDLNDLMAYLAHTEKARQAL